MVQQSSVDFWRIKFPKKNEKKLKIHLHLVPTMIEWFVIPKAEKSLKFLETVSYGLWDGIAQDHGQFSYSKTKWIVFCI